MRYSNHRLPLPLFLPSQKRNGTVVNPQLILLRPLIVDQDEQNADGTHDQRRKSWHPNRHMLDLYNDPGVLLPPKNI